MRGASIDFAADPMSMSDVSMVTTEGAIATMSERKTREEGIGDREGENCAK